MHRITDNFYSEKPTFETRLLFAQLLSPYDVYAESKYGYLDGSKICLEGNKSIEELQALLEASTGSDNYEKGFRQAIKDYIKQEKSREVTNE